MLAVGSFRVVCLVQIFSLSKFSLVMKSRWLMIVHAKSFQNSASISITRHHVLLRLFVRTANWEIPSKRTIDSFDWDKDQMWLNERKLLEFDYSPGNSGKSSCGKSIDAALLILIHSGNRTSFLKLISRQTPSPKAMAVGRLSRDYFRSSGTCHLCAGEDEATWHPLGKGRENQWNQRTKWEFRNWGMLSKIFGEWDAVLDNPRIFSRRLQ